MDQADIYRKGSPAVAAGSTQYWMSAELKLTVFDEEEVTSANRSSTLASEPARRVFAKIHSVIREFEDRKKLTLLIEIFLVLLG